MNNVLFVFLLSIFPYANTCLQNLIPNPGFEDVNICHEYKHECCPKAWRTTEYKSVKYNNRNKKGSTLTSSFIELPVFDQARDFDRKFIQTELLCGLKKDEQYKLSLRIKQGNFMVNSISAAFNEQVFFSENNNDLSHKKPDLVFSIPYKLDKGEWVTLEQVFTANGNEKVIMIGNFSPDSLSGAKPVNPKAYKKAKKNYNPKMRVIYGIDDVSLTPINPLPDCSLEQNKIRIYGDSTRHTFKQLGAETPVIAAIPEIPAFVPQKGKARPAQKMDTIILDNIGFEFGKAILPTERFPELEKIKKLLKNNNQINIEINGYTDNIGSVEDNLKLSEDRAKAVFEYLVNEGISSKRMAFKGHGESYPLGDNGTEEGRRMNRRVEVVIMEKVETGN